MERKTFLVPFDCEKIRVRKEFSFSFDNGCIFKMILRCHLPNVLLETVDKAIDFYEQKRLRYGVYCQQLELNYSSWERFIQHSLFDMNN